MSEEERGQRAAVPDPPLPNDEKCARACAKLQHGQKLHRATLLLFQAHHCALETMQEPRLCSLSTTQGMRSL